MKMRLSLRGTAIAATGIALSVLVSGTPAAFAVGAGGVFYGDVTGDGVADRLSLGSRASVCTVTVEPRLAGGRYAAPVVHDYTIPDTSFCPDMGVVLPGHSKINDLVVTWFSGPPPGASSNAFVLRRLRTVIGSAGEKFPSIIGTQDFNGDRRADFWESTDQALGFQSFLRKGRTFEVGPAAYFSMRHTAPSFGALDRRRGTDLAAGYVSFHDQAGLPGSGGSGVLVIFGASGKKTLLEHDPDGAKTYSTALFDANRDGHLDVRVTDNRTPGARMYLNDGRGCFSLANAPAARV